MYGIYYVCSINLVLNINVTNNKKWGKQANFHVLNLNKIQNCTRNVRVKF